MNFSWIVANENKLLSELLKENSIEQDYASFLSIKWTSDNTNWNQIKKYYNSDQLSENLAKYPSGEILVVAGTVLYTQPDKINRDPSRQISGDVVTLSQYKPFIAKQLKNLLDDPNYKVEKYDHDEKRVYLDHVFKGTVLIFSRIQNRWYRPLSIESISTNVMSENGSFSIRIADLNCLWNEKDGWVQTDVQQSPIENQIGQVNIVGNEVKNFLFNTILRNNDLIFIKHNNDVRDIASLRKGKGASEDVDGLDVASGQVWDMIGLIDRVTNSLSPNSVTTTIVGRDLMKLLIDDGSIFFASQFAGNIFVDDNSLLAKRNKFSLIEQAVIYQMAVFKPVSALLKYLINKFSNLGLVPNEAFRVYGNRQILDKYDLITNKQLLKSTVSDPIDLLNAKNSTLIGGERQGAWRICDLLLDDDVTERSVADPSFSQDNGSVINSIRKIVQSPFLEFYGDTYKDKYYFTCRKPPFDKVGYIGLVYGSIKVEASKEVAFDGGLALSRQLGLETNKNTISNYVIDIDEADVFNSNLVDHSEVYSWYRVIPRGLGAFTEESEFLLAPIVSFDEYAEIWGSKTLSIEYNYTPTVLFNNDIKSSRELKYLETQTFLDLQYLIQSTQYLPFARRGTIVISGNPTIKRGMFVYYKPTNEVFYVDGVQHETVFGQSTSATTILTVSRGLRLSFIKGKKVELKDGKSLLVSYFDIINTEIKNISSIDSRDVLKNWKVNKDVFDFFVKRKQWID